MSAESSSTALEAAVASGASKVTYVGSGATIFGTVVSDQFTVFFGAAIALLGFVVNFYFRLKEDRRLQALHDLKMKQLEPGDTA